MKRNKLGGVEITAFAVPHSKTAKRTRKAFAQPMTVIVDEDVAQHFNNNLWLRVTADGASLMSPLPQRKSICEHIYGVPAQRKRPIGSGNNLTRAAFGIDQPAKLKIVKRYPPAS